MREIDSWKLLLYAVLLNLMVAVTAVFLHELGHAAVGLLTRCSAATIEVGFPHLGVSTTLDCTTSFPGIVGLGGFLLTVPFTLAFFAVPGDERSLGWVALGLTLYTASVDVSRLAGQVFFPLLMFSGIGAIIYGEDLLARSFRGGSVSQEI